MKVLDDCHTYLLDTFLNEGKGMSPGQYHTSLDAIIHFYEMRDGTKIDGVTNEEVLRVLIHRLECLDNKFTCKENGYAILDLKDALEWLEKRTKNRIDRRVEGKMEP